MKKLLIVSLLLPFFISLLNSGDYQNSLIAYWSFDDGSAKDFSGNNLHGQIMNHPKIVKGINGFNALRFVGSGLNTTDGDHILLPRIKFEELNEFTISMWVKEESMTSDYGEAYINFGDHVKGFLGIANFKYRYTTGDSIFTHYSVGSNYDFAGNPIKPLIIYFDKKLRNKWVHHVMVYKNGTIYAYRNGRLLDSLKQDVNIVTNMSELARHSWSNGSMIESSTRFIGCMDEIKIFSTALNKIEIANEFMRTQFHDLCGNEQITLTAPEGYKSYLWSNGSIEQSIIVSKSGDYSVRIVSFTNDTIYSELFHIFF